MIFASETITQASAGQRKSKLGFKRQDHLIRNTLFMNTLRTYEMHVRNAMFFSLDSPHIPHIIITLHPSTLWIKKISPKHFTMLQFSL